MILDFNAANYFAYVFDNNRHIGHIDFSMDEKELLVYLLKKLIDGSFLFSTESMDNQGQRTGFENLLGQLESFDGSVIPEFFYEELRGCLGSRQWMALIIPSGNNKETDRILCDPKLLDLVVKNMSYNQGMVLQLDEAPENIFSCHHVYPAFETALNDVIHWPGMLIWVSGGDSIFLPVSREGDNEIEIEMRVQWIFSQLSDCRSFNPGLLKLTYQTEFPELFEFHKHQLHILQLNDVFLGDQIVKRRINCVKELINDGVQSLEESSRVAPLISGNLLQNPKESNLPAMLDFWQYLEGLGIEQPIWTLGVTDVRRDGQLNDCFKTPVNLTADQVFWFDNEKVAIINLDTVGQGNQELGSISSEQLEEIQYEIERKPGYEEFLFVAVMHHALLAESIDSKVHSEIKATIGDINTSGAAIAGAENVIQFFQQYGVQLVLQGKGSVLPGMLKEHIPVAGCGSLTGLHSKENGEVFFCINQVTVNSKMERLACRTILCRMPQQGLTQHVRHEFVSIN